MSDWRTGDEGVRKYRRACAEARAKATWLKSDVGIEGNDFARDYFIRALPPPHQRFGHELRVYVVHPGEPLSTEELVELGKMCAEPGAKAKPWLEAELHREWA